jgi:hypothetical protein
MEEEKCNSEQDLNSNPSQCYYDDASFESYSDDDLALSLSDSFPSLGPTPTDTFQVMLK